MIGQEVLEIWILASQEIWKFVSKFDVNGLIDCGTVETNILNLNLLNYIQTQLQ